MGGLDHKLQQGAENLSEYRSELWIYRNVPRVLEQTGDRQMIPTYASQSYVSMNVGGYLYFPTAYRQELLLSIVWLWDSMVSPFYPGTARRYYQLVDRRSTIF